MLNADRRFAAATSLGKPKRGFCPTWKIGARGEESNPQPLAYKASALPFELLWQYWNRRKTSRPVSRVLSRAIIHLGPPSPTASSSLPGSACELRIASLFGLASDGVYPAAVVTLPRGALLPHHFTLTR